MKKQSIAIIGGMGPEASVYLYKELIRQSIDFYHAVNNDDFPEIIIHSIPVPDFISSDERRNEALEILKEKVKMLNLLNPLCIAIACNTAHTLLEDLQNISKTPFVSMIDEVVIAVNNDKIKKIGLLGTPSTLKSKMYQDALKKFGIISMLPTETEINILEKIVRNVIAGTASKSDTDNLVQLAKRLTADGVEGIILGCTELPLIFPDNYPFRIYNSVEILSIALLKKYYSQSG